MNSCEPWRPGMKADLAVVVITRNEEARVGQCLSASIRAVQEAKEAGLVRSAEIVLVDSASRDRTIEIARQFPITIVRLDAGWPLSAAAGRFVGLRNTDSELVLFVDGDYVLFDRWLPSAIRAIRSDPHIAAVCGPELEESTGDSALMRFLKRNTESTVGVPEAIPIGLYRRQAVVEVGGIQPFLKGGEDRDLANRLRASGYALVRIEPLMGSHRWSDSERLDFITYFKSVLSWSIGDGQAFRAALGGKRARIATIRRYANIRHLLSYLRGIAFGAVLLANLLLPIPGLSPFVVASDFAVLILMEAVRRSRGLSWREFLFEFHSAPYSMVRHGGFLVGLIRPPHDAEDYPTGERVIQFRPRIDSQGER